MQLGKTQPLRIVKKVDFGVYLAEEEDQENRVLLPVKQVPEGAKTGDELEVFLYKDSKDRLIATTAEPYITLGKVARLKVKEVTKIGAFRESVRHIVGVQFRNVATVGGSIWGRFGFSDVMTIFRALGAKVELHHAGMMDLDDFVKLPRKTRDILVAVIVPKNVKGVVYVSQRNQSTDFPVLTCAVAKRADGYAAAIGATPHLAEVVVVPERELSELSDEQMDAFAGQVCDEIRFGSNMRAGAAYRKTVCRVLVRRAMQALKGELD